MGENTSVFLGYHSFENRTGICVSRGDKTRRMRWAGHVARTGWVEEKCVQDFGGET